MGIEDLNGAIKATAKVIETGEFEGEFIDPLFLLLLTNQALIMEAVQVLLNKQSTHGQ